ncbi:MAG TPA: hypothetical protein VFM39_06720 [bacterium]|nr:hypothetical protein [bacterium]
MLIDLTPAFCLAFPSGLFGALIVRGCPNRTRATALVAEKRAVEARLRERFGVEGIDGDPVARAYAEHFRRHGTRYPVVHQAKAVLQGRSIESPSALVEVMFTAELDSLVLTSGHDLESLSGPLRVDVALDGDVYTKLSLKEQTTRRGDMVVRDAEGIIASVLYGPDHRTRVREETTAALFGAWCPLGITAAAVEAHLDTVAVLVRREWPDAAIDPPRIVSASALLQ